MEIKLGERIDNLRRKKNISVEEIADDIGTGKRNVYDLFKRDDMLISQLMKISELLDYDFLEHYKPAVTRNKEKHKELGESYVGKRGHALNFTLHYSADEDGIEAVGRFMMHAHAMAQELDLGLS